MEALRFVLCGVVRQEVRRAMERREGGQSRARRLFSSESDRPRVRSWSAGHSWFRGAETGAGEGSVRKPDPGIVKRLQKIGASSIEEAVGAHSRRALKHTYMIVHLHASCAHTPWRFTRGLAFLFTKVMSGREWTVEDVAYRVRHRETYCFALTDKSPTDGLFLRRRQLELELSHDYNGQQD